MHAWGANIIPGCPNASWWLAVVCLKTELAASENIFRRNAWESQPVLSSEAFTAKFEETFKRVFPRYFESQIHDRHFINWWTGQPDDYGMPAEAACKM